MPVHVIPLNDEQEHEKSTSCWCEPTVNWIDPDTNRPWANGSCMVVHNAADCREFSEQVTGEGVSPSQKWETSEVSS
jgi:hypothetical protein